MVSAHDPGNGPGTSGPGIAGPSRIRPRQTADTATDLHRSPLVTPDTSGKPGHSAYQGIQSDISARSRLLKRCTPSKVATVLQAVHLLLAFPLFVVVVGVDSRWVGRALRKQYPELLAGEDVEPRDYLEKIFQVPFWLDRMDRSKTTRMLRGITGAGATSKTNGTVQSIPPANSESPPIPNESDGPPDQNAPEPPVGPDVRAQIARSRELNPRGLGIEAHELAAMERLSELLGRSPRSLKRFVNVYRLMKVRAPDPLDFSDPDRADADYLVVLLLLAEMIGRPDEARALFNWIRQTTDTEIDVPSGWPRSTSLYKQWIDDVSRFGFDGLVQPDSA